MEVNYDKLTFSNGKKYYSVMVNSTFLQIHDDAFEIQTDPAAYTDVHSALADAGYEIIESDIEYVPSMESAPKDEHDVKKLKKMIDILEDNDDVQKVHHNCSLDLEEVEY